MKEKSYQARFKSGFSMTVVGLRIQEISGVIKEPG
jgi:hypothetical protein